MPQKLSKGFDRLFKGKVEVAHAQRSNAADDRRTQAIEDFAFRNSADYINQYKPHVARMRECLAEQRKLDGLKGRVLAAELKEAHGLKLGLRERIGLRLGRRRAERQEAKVADALRKLAEMAADGLNTGGPEHIAFFGDMARVVEITRAEHEAAQDEVWDPTPEIMEEMGYETPKMQEAREAEELEDLRDHGMHEGPETEDTLSPEALELSDTAADRPRESHRRPVEAAALGFSPKQNAPGAKKDTTERTAAREVGKTSEKKGPELDEL